MAHIVIIPVSLIFYFSIMDINENSSPLLIQVVAILSLLIEIWFSAIISRGINLVYSFQPLFKRLVFPVVFIWNSIFRICAGLCHQQLGNAAFQVKQ